MKRRNLRNIKALFSERTGTAVGRRRRPRRAAIMALAAAALTAALATAAAGLGGFSPLYAEKLGFSAVYAGDGILVITIENGSDREIRLRPALTLERWRTGETVGQLSEDIVFSDTLLPARETKPIEVDLSHAFDVAALEEPLTDDWYVLTLAVDDIYGTKFPLSVSFAETIRTPEPFTPTEADRYDAVTAALADDSLRFYFEVYPELMTPEIQELGLCYYEAYTRLIAECEGTVVSPIVPGIGSMYTDGRAETRPTADFVLHDPTMSIKEQAERWGAQKTYFDVNNKLLATAEDHAWVVSAYLPGVFQPGTLIEIPLFYLFVYDRAQILPERYTFLRGRLYTFGEMEPYIVYEDEDYVIYDMSHLVYSDLDAYARLAVARAWHEEYDDEAAAALHETYDYVKQNLTSMILYRDEYYDLTGTRPRTG